MTDVRPLGPETIFWRLTGDWRTMLLAGRALVMQTAYPAVGAGVGEHSVYKTDPYGRLDRTMRSVMAQVYGGEQAVEEGRRLREMHRDIKGVDAKGRRYSALNPDAYLWVHATAFEGFLVFLERFDRPASQAETQQLFDEWRRLGLVLGIPDRQLPRTVPEFWETWDRLVANLEDNWDDAVALAGEARARIWRLYMAGSALNFEANRTQIHQLLGVKPDGGNSQMPLRPDWEPLT